MGRMHDALRKAAEERERRRRRRASEGGVTVPPQGDLASLFPLSPVGVQPDPSEEGPPEVVSPGELSSLAVEEAPAAVAPPPRGRAARAREKAEREAEQRQAVADGRFDPRLVTFLRPRDPRAEEYRNVRASLLTLEEPPRSILVTSGSPGEGKSLAAANLAVSLVEGGTRRVLLIDANLRHPQLHGILGVRPRGGVSEVLEQGPSELSSLVASTGVAGLDLLSAGNRLDNPGGLLIPKAFSGVLGLLEERYDFVVVDAPSLEEYADAAVLAPEVDGVILVVQVEGPARSQTERALQVLERARARVLGAIATNCRI